MKENYITASYVEKEYFSIANPILAPFYRALNTSDSNSGLKEKSLINSYESIVKYITTILISKYHKDGLKDDHIDNNIKKLTNPAIGTYVSVMRDILNKYKKLRSSEFILQLEEAFTSKLSSRIFEIAKIVAEENGTAIPKNSNNTKLIIDILATYRNEDAHGGAKEEHILQNKINNLIILINELIVKFRFIGEKELIEIYNLTKKLGEIKFETHAWNGLNQKKEKLELNTTDLKDGHLYFKINNELLDLFPYCSVFQDKDTKKQTICFLNKTKKSKLTFLSYNTGNKFEIIKSDKLFDYYLEHFDPESIRDGGEGVESHLQELIETVTTISKEAFQKAIIEINNNNINAAITHLKYSIDKSPGYLKAVVKLAKLYENDERYKEAHNVLNDYIDIIPKPNIDILLYDTKVLFYLKKKNEAKARISKILSIDKSNIEALDLLQKVDSLPDDSIVLKENTIDDENITEDKVFTIYDIIFKKINLKPKWKFPAIFVFISLFSGLLSVLFFKDNNIIMSITIVFFNLLWFSIIWANYRMKRLLINGKLNFHSFYRSSIENFDKHYSIMIAKIFGIFPSNIDILDTNNNKYIKKIKRANIIRFVAILIASIFLTIWYNKLTVTTFPSNFVSFYYIIFLFLFSLSFIYLVSCLIIYNSMISSFQADQIHYSLVQHPKLSIRYLSFLSRKITYPILLIYFLFCSSLYIGPFAANLSFIGFFSVFLFFVLSIYYSTIFRIKSLISKKKWNLISEFSVHFNEPFTDLIKKGDSKDMDRINKLIEIRKFIESMNSWAEKPLVLVFTSILFFFIVFSSIYGVSHLFTKKIVPIIHGKQAKIYSKKIIKTKTLNTKYLDIEINNVDDFAMVFWVDSVLSEDNYNKFLKVALDNKEIQENNTNNGIFFCKWDNGVHGNLKNRIELNKDKVIVVVVFNTVFKDFLGIAGGKMSYDIKLKLNNKVILDKIDFIRMNTREIGYITQIKFNKKLNQLDITEGMSNLGNQFKKLATDIKNSIGIVGVTYQ